jgi:hypothetical protein
LRAQGAQGWLFDAREVADALPELQQGQQVRLVNLSPTEVMLAAHKAGVINGLKQQQEAHGQIKNRRVSDLDDFGMHYMGALSEAAVAGVLGVPVRTDITFFGDGFIDLIYRGQTVQVKCRAKPSFNGERYAFLNHLSEFVAEWLVLCSVQSPSCIGIHGFISRAKFTKIHFKHDFGYGPRVCVKESSLAPIEDMTKAVQIEVAA